MKQVLEAIKSFFLFPIEIIKVIRDGIREEMCAKKEGELGVGFALICCVHIIGAVVFGTSFINGWTMSQGIAGICLILLPILLPLLLSAAVCVLYFAVSPIVLLDALIIAVIRGCKHINQLRHEERKAHSQVNNIEPESPKISD